MLGRKRAGKEQQEESSKKQKLEKEKESDKVDEVDEAELKKLLVIKKDEDIAIDAIPVATKLPAKYGDTRPENEFERVLYGDLKVMFEPNIKSDIWRMLQGYSVTIWKLIDSSGVHFVRRNLKIQKMNIKFRGGLLGLKRLHGFLEVTAAQVWDQHDVVRDDDQPQDASEPKTAKTPNPDWFIQPPRPPTPDPEWNKRQYVLNRHKIDNLTQDILSGPAYNLLKYTCSSSVKLEYHFQECFNALTNKLDWNNPEGDRYPFDLSKPLPLQGHPGHLPVAADYFFNNDLEYLKSSDPERTYTTLITKTKAARYEIIGIEDMVPMLWSPTKMGYDKDALKGIKHWGEGRKLWHRSQLNKFSKHNVYSTQNCFGVKSVSVKKLHGYGYLEEIMAKIADRQLYKLKEGDFVDLHLIDIEDMLLLTVQHKLFHLTGNDIVDFIVALCMFTRSLIIKKRVKDLQLGVESYQKKLNITPPQQTFPEIEFKELDTPSHKPPGVIYKYLTKQKSVMRADELYKFSDKTLKKVRDELHQRVRDFRLKYNKEMPRRRWTVTDRKRSELMVELIDKQMRERRII
ncbi:hypothetical protein Tco_1144606 [Tanacetum coccineum]